MQSKTCNIIVKIVNLATWGRGSSTHCVCVCVSVTTVMSTVSPLKGKVRYKQKVLDVGTKMNLGKRSWFKLWELLAYSEILTHNLRLEIDASMSPVLFEEDYWYIK